MDLSEKSEHKNRLDVEMALRGLARSRSEADDLIDRKLVTVNGIEARKSSMNVSANDVILVTSPLRFVSRAGEKLDRALDAFSIDAQGLIALDIGSSTGGFVDRLLRGGAQRVIAVDVGTGQFAKELIGDPRVELHESTDIRNFSVPTPVDIVTIDVSFISLSLVLPKAYDLVRPGGTVITLVKPQFEVGMETAKKFKGVITDDSIRKDVMGRIKRQATDIGFTVLNETDSPIEGEKGNKEFFLLLQK